MRFPTATALRGFRRLPAAVRTLAVLPLLLLLQVTQFESGTHAHPNDRAAGHCPVCVHAHAPAIETTEHPALTPPAGDVERPRFAPVAAPSAHAPRLAASRGPPRA